MEDKQWKAMKEFDFFEDKRWKAPEGGTCTPRLRPSGPAEPVREYLVDTDNPYWMAHSEVTALAAHPNSARFHTILKELGELHDKKQADYGRGDDPFANVRASTEWGVPAWVGVMIRLSDKVRRLQSLALKGKLANESAEDSLRDIAVYAIIALVLREQEGVK